MSYHIQNILLALSIVFVLNILNSTNIYISVLNLLLIFSIYFLFLTLLNFDFIAQAIIIIYAGALIILFLLVMMLFNAPSNNFLINKNRKKLNYNLYILLFLFFITILFFILFYAINNIFLITFNYNNLQNYNSYDKSFLNYYENNNIINIGNHLFYYYSFELFLFGLLLFLIIFATYIYFNMNYESDFKNN